MLRTLRSFFMDEASWCRKCGTGVMLLFMYVSFVTKRMTTQLTPKTRRRKRSWLSIETGGSAAAFSQVLLQRAEVALLRA
jgi:hypothetical protein